LIETESRNGVADGPFATGEGLPGYEKARPHPIILGKRVVFKGSTEHCQAKTGKKINKTGG
jgi:hypothetical protein